MAGLVGAGLPLERALTALADESENPRQRELIAHLRSEVNAGSPFARALAGAPREFDEVYCAVVAAGEQSGALGRVLERLADDLEERQALRAKLLGAMLYPAIVSLIAIVIVIFLVTYVVPQVASVFTSSKRALPGLTVAMLAISAFVRSWGWLLAGPDRGRQRRIRHAAPQPRLPRAQRRGVAEPAAGRPAGARLQRGALFQHAGHAGRGRRADPEGAAGGGRNPGQPRDARRRDGRAGAGARRRAAGLGDGGEEALPGTAGDVRSAGRADRPAAGDARPRGRASSAPRCSAAPWRWRPSSSRC